MRKNPFAKLAALLLVMVMLLAAIPAAAAPAVAPALPLPPAMYSVASALV